MDKLFSILLLFAISLQLINAETFASDVCEVHGFTHFRGFNDKNFALPCNQFGAKVLLKNKWIKVFSHSYTNDISHDIDWLSTKFFIEFYGDIPEVPIAMYSSDDLLDMFRNERNSEVYEYGVHGAIELLTESNDDFRVAYLNYKRANITLYLRQVVKGFNFGIRQPQFWTLNSEGICVSGCPKISIHSDENCLTAANIKKVEKICEKAFSESSLENIITFKKHRLTKCAHDILIWQDVNLVIDHIYAILDELFITNFDQIASNYNFKIIDQNKIPGLQSNISVKCLDNVSPIFQNKSQFPTTPKNTAEMSNQTSAMQPNRNKSLPTSQDAPEFSSLCKSSSELESFQIAFPKDRSLIIECISGKPILKKCPTGTIFSAEKTTCEPFETTTL